MLSQKWVEVIIVEEEMMPLRWIVVGLNAVSQRPDGTKKVGHQRKGERETIGAMIIVKEGVVYVAIGRQLMSRHMYKYILKGECDHKGLITRGALARGKISSDVWPSHWH